MHIFQSFSSWFHCFRGFQLLLKEKYLKNHGCKCMNIWHLLLTVISTLYRCWKQIRCFRILKNDLDLLWRKKLETNSNKFNRNFWTPNSFKNIMWIRNLPWYRQPFYQWLGTMDHLKLSINFLLKNWIKFWKQN